MHLQITHDHGRLMDRAKELGFTSGSWRTGDSMEGVFHKNRFKAARLVWQMAFNTHAR
jgi:hypothetical protein